MSTENKTIDAALIPAVSPGFRLQFEKSQDTWVLLYPEGMVKLNQSAAEIMKRCDGSRDVNQVVKQLETDFDESDLLGDVIGFMEVAIEQKWITMKDKSDV